MNLINLIGYIVWQSFYQLNYFPNPNLPDIYRFSNISFFNLKAFLNTNSFLTVLLVFKKK